MRKNKFFKIKLILGKQDKFSTYLEPIGEYYCYINKNNGLDTRSIDSEGKGSH